MHLIKLSDVNHSSSVLTPAVLQAAQMLGLYHAELARILKLQCADVGELANAQKFLEVDSIAWQQAEKFILIFESLYLKFQGNEALMCNWLRKQNSILNGIPLYLMVDEGGVEDVFCFLQNESLSLFLKE